MKPHVIVVALLLATLGGCSNEKEAAEWRAAKAAIEPFKIKFQQLQAALPPPGSEVERRCEGAIPAEGLETIDTGLLAWALGEGRADERHPTEQQSLSSDKFNGLRYHLDPGDKSDPDTGALINLKRSADELAAIRYMVVFRASDIDRGHIGDQQADGSYAIERPARWRGWVFVYAFEDEPQLRAALPLDATSRDWMTVSVQPGYAPSQEELIYGLALDLRTTIRTRLAKPGCPPDAAP